jgi:hypothetical protein
MGVDLGVEMELDRGVRKSYILIKMLRFLYM